MQKNTWIAGYRCANCGQEFEKRNSQRNKPHACPMCRHINSPIPEKDVSPKSESHFFCLKYE